MSILNDFLDWIVSQYIGYDIWDRREQKLYSLPLWLSIKYDEYSKIVRKVKNEK